MRFLNCTMMIEKEAIYLPYHKSVAVMDQVCSSSLQQIDKEQCWQRTPVHVIRIVS